MGVILQVAYSSLDDRKSKQAIHDQSSRLLPYMGLYFLPFFQTFLFSYSHTGLLTVSGILQAYYIHPQDLICPSSFYCKSPHFLEDSAHTPSNQSFPTIHLKKSHPGIHYSIYQS